MNKKTIENLEQDFEKTKNNLAEFTELRDAQRAKVSQLESDFVENKSLLDELQTERGRLETLTSTVNNLTGERERLEKQLAAARAAAAENVLLEISKGKAIEAADLGEAYLQSYNEFLEIIGNSGKNLLEALLEFRNKQHEYRVSVRDIKSNFPESRVGEKLTEFGVSDNQLKLASAENLNLPASAFALAIDQILKIQIGLKEQEARRERYAATNS